MSAAPGGRSATARLAGLAGRVTDRDRALCQLLFDHRVLTTPQLVDLAFPSRNAAEHRLVLLAPEEVAAEMAVELRQCR